MAGPFALLARLFDPGLGVGELSRRLQIDAAQLVSFEPTYRTFTLAKRSGGKRQIEAPDEILKAVQRRILRRVLGGLKAHPAALGFERGRSIVHHADAHAGQAVVIRLDVMDFFTSTPAERIYDYFRFIGWNRTASRLLTMLTTHNGRLPQGAPTSPRLSNLVNFRMDARLAGLIRDVSAGAGVYTRYADDLTFSLAREKNDDVRRIVRGASAIARDEGYVLHRKKKTHIQRAHQRQMVTGLVVNHSPGLPREKRRLLRAVGHRLRLDRAATLTQQQLAGWRSLLHMIETQRTCVTRSRHD